MPILLRIVICFLVLAFCTWQGIGFVKSKNMPFSIAVGSLALFNLGYLIYLFTLL